MGAEWVVVCVGAGFECVVVCDEWVVVCVAAAEECVVVCDVVAVWCVVDDLWVELCLAFALTLAFFALALAFAAFLVVAVLG